MISKLVKLTALSARRCRAAAHQRAAAGSQRVAHSTLTPPTAAAPHVTRTTTTAACSAPGRPRRCRVYILFTPSATRVLEPRQPFRIPPICVAHSTLTPPTAAAPPVTRTTTTAACSAPGRPRRCGVYILFTPSATRVLEPRRFFRARAAEITGFVLGFPSNRTGIALGLSGPWHAGQKKLVRE